MKIVIEAESIDELKALLEQITNTETHPVLERKISEIGLSVRSVNCLMSQGIQTLEHLSTVGISDLLKIRNLGKRSAYEIANKAKEFGLIIKYKVN